MMRLFLAGLILLSAAGALFFLPGALAMETRPGADFAYGARVDLGGQHVDPAIRAAAGLGMDWIALDFDWAARMPEANQMPDLGWLEAAIDAARQGRLRVMLSLANTPAWAASPAGPDARLTASLVVSLARLYGDVLRAVELFPAANTRAGWGATPDPAGYALLMQTVRAALQSNGLPVTLVTSLSPAIAPGDFADRAFLEDLYAHGAAGWMPVVGVWFPNLSGQPNDDPAGGAGIVLRHFEALREVMIRNEHASGRVWITGFSWPGEAAYGTPEGQAQWVSRAYKLLRAQIYIEAAFFRQLNPPAPGSDQATGFITSLILPDGRLHPACEPLSQLTSLGGTEQKTHFQAPVTKKTLLKSTMKP